MVETYELERKIQDEETKKIWASIDNEFLDKCEKHRQWYLNFTKKEHHPISYQVKKEVEEWERSAPLFKEFDDLQSIWLYLCVAYMIGTFSIGLLLVAYMLG